MGILDRIKPHTPPVRPADLALNEQGGLTIRWEDGRESNFAPLFLRARCPCAECVEEWTGRRTVGEAQVASGIRCAGMSTVGNYAVQLNWSDKHQTGIYSWDYLLKLRDEANPAP